MTLLLFMISVNFKSIPYLNHKNHNIIDNNNTIDNIIYNHKHNHSIIENTDVIMNDNKICIENHHLLITFFISILILIIIIIIIFSFFVKKTNEINNSLFMRETFVGNNPLHSHISSKKLREQLWMTIIKNDGNNLRETLNEIPSQFDDSKVSDLQPVDWRQNVIGSGSYADVCLGYLYSKKVAVKKIKIPTLSHNPSEKEKNVFKTKIIEIMSDYTKEIETLVKCQHENLINCLGFTHGYTNDLLIVQEYCEGKALDQQIYIENWKPTIEQILNISIQIASGMQYLHNINIIHRDLKSPNILISKDPLFTNDFKIKISDFGLSREKNIIDGQTQLMTGCGSVLWMAPEILLGQKYNEKIDVFSYAMCLIELINLNLPWYNINSIEVPHKVTNNLRPLNQLYNGNDGILFKISNLIRKCWNQQSSSRPSFTDIIEELNQ